VSSLLLAPPLPLPGGGGATPPAARSGPADLLPPASRPPLPPARIGYLFVSVLVSHQNSGTRLGLLESTYCVAICFSSAAVYCFHVFCLWRTVKNQYKKFETRFPEKDLCGHSPNFYIQVSVSNLYIPTIEPPILLREICGQILGIYKSLTDT
jgi:hypothetical protein